MYTSLYAGGAAALSPFIAARSTWHPQHTVAPGATRSATKHIHHPVVPTRVDFTAPPRIDQNALLAALPIDDTQRWHPHLQPVDLQLGQVLYESGCTPAYVYFPTSAVVSLMCMTQDGKSAEIAVVGSDGVVGMSLIMGGNATPSQAVVQSAGQAFRIRSAMISQEFTQGGPVLTVFLRYVQAVMSQMAQTALCNRHHSIEQQLCRRLLQALDRSDSRQLAMTHELLARLLGVRREGVTAAAHRLQLAGVIDYNRGQVDVINRPRMESMACECYVAGKRGRLFPVQ